MELVEQGHDLTGRHRVEVARRLVGQDQVGVGHECACDGHPLLLATRELARAVVDAVAEPDAVQ